MKNRIENIRIEAVRIGQLVNYVAVKALTDTRFHLAHDVLDAVIAQHPFIALLPMNNAFLAYKISRTVTETDIINSFLRSCSYQLWEKLALCRRVTAIFKDALLL